MPVDVLLQRLEGVRRTGADRWIAQCPSHQDRRPSLSIREVSDGRVLCHCFSGCSVEEVLSAVGLELSDLFPEGGLADRLPRERRPFNTADVLKCVAFEAEITSVAADNLANGITLTDTDRARLRCAAVRLREAGELTHD